MENIVKDLKGSRFVSIDHVVGLFGLGYDKDVLVLSDVDVSGYYFKLLPAVHCGSRYHAHEVCITYSEAFDFLTGRYELYPIVSPKASCPDYVITGEGFHVDVLDYNDEDVLGDDGVYSYGEALDACLGGMIRICNEKKNKNKE